MDTLTLYDKSIPIKYKNKLNIINNAFFAGFLTYYLNQNEFKEEYYSNYSPDLKSYIQFIVQKYGRR